MSPGKPAILAEGLVKRFGKTEALRGLNLRVEEGTVLGLLGPNGAGKTTAVRIFATLLTPDAGRATVAGLDVVAQADQLRSLIGLTGQYAAVDEYLTGQENLEMVGRLYHLAPRDAKRRATELLERFDLTDAAGRIAKTYSGGMRRRLDLAAGLVLAPPVLFLDEPTTGLDPQARHLIWDGLRQLLTQGKTILLTTHFMDEAERLATKLAVIDHGTLIASDTPPALLAAHVEPEVVEVYGDDAKAWAESRGRELAQRMEIAGETAFCYAIDAKPLLADLTTRSGLHYLHRPANLEDLFIKLTGRELRG